MLDDDAETHNQSLDHDTEMEKYLKTISLTEHMPSFVIIESFC